MKSRSVQRYLSTIMLIRKAYLAGRPFVTCRFHPELNTFLKMLAQHGFIRSYELSAGRNTAIVWVKGARRADGSFVPAVVEAHRLPHCQRNAESISLTFLKRLSRHEGGAALYFLSTDRGLITHLDAIRLNVGGKILFRLV